MSLVLFPSNKYLKYDTLNLTRLNQIIYIIIMSMIYFSHYLLANGSNLVLFLEAFKSYTLTKKVFIINALFEFFGNVSVYSILTEKNHSGYE